VVISCTHEFGRSLRLRRRDPPRAPFSTRFSPAKAGCDPVAQMPHLATLVHQVPPALGGPFDTLLIVVGISGSLRCPRPKICALLWGLTSKKPRFLLKNRCSGGGACIISHRGEIAQVLRGIGRRMSGMIVRVDVDRRWK
jgi:hypothetical protein